MARAAKSSHTPNLFTLFSLHFHIPPSTRVDMGAKKPSNQTPQRSQSNAAPSPYRSGQSNTIPNSPAIWIDLASRGPRYPHPNEDSPLVKEAFNSLVGSNTTAWECDSYVKSLTDAYTKLGLTLEEGNKLTVEVTNCECILC